MRERVCRKVGSRRPDVYIELELLLPAPERVARYQRPVRGKKKFDAAIFERELETGLGRRDEGRVEDICRVEETCRTEGPERVDTACAARGVRRDLVVEEVRESSGFDGVWE